MKQKHFWILSVNCNTVQIYHVYPQNDLFHSRHHPQGAAVNLRHGDANDNLQGTSEGSGDLMSSYPQLWETGLDILDTKQL